MTRLKKSTVDGFAPGAMPLCVFCSKPWTEDMLRLMHGARVGTGYYGDPEDVTLYETIDITCSHCERLIYRKEMEKTISAYSQFSPE